MRELTVSLKKGVQQFSWLFLGIGLTWGFGDISSLAQAAEWATSGNNIYNTNSGNVGIGTTSPNLKLQVGNVIPGNPPTSGTGQTGGFSLRGVAPTENTLMNFGISSTSPYGGWIQVSDASDLSINYPLRLNPNGGNVGIGTSSPNLKLQVGNVIPGNPPTSGTGQTGGFSLRGAAPMENTLMNFGISSTSPYGGWIQVSDASDLAINYPLRLNPNGGNVGIGTASPNKILELNSTDPSIRFQYTGNAGWAQVSSDGANQLMFYAESLERVRIDTSGNVGIGTTNPGIYKLYVNGDAFVQGNIAAKYQDIAEWVPASESIPAGTVLILDSDHFNQVEASSQAYDTRVAGVITDTPGILLGEGGEGKVKVATTGRVKVKVDATRAPVQVGDLLVTSDREGYAMKSQPIDVGGIPIHRPGTLIGKALEPLKGGQGEILVLLSLQ